MRLPALDRLRALRPTLPRPARWDWAALGILLAGLVLTGANLLLARGDEPAPAGVAMLFVFLHLAVACGGLLALGKTAKEGTGLGNLAAVGAMFVGLGGVMLASALWAMA
ncbi:MAG TPA: hypothetical protein VF121_10580 [Thermoanaerobaculia bacterium]|nr:hypothetical protein [Thermoanaerobaculia bacterium]